MKPNEVIRLALETVGGLGQVFTIQDVVTYLIEEVQHPCCVACCARI